MKTLSHTLMTYLCAAECGKCSVKKPSKKNLIKRGDIKAFLKKSPVFRYYTKQLIKQAA